MYGITTHKSSSDPRRGPRGEADRPADCRAGVKELQHKARFMRITNAALRESHVHDVAITRESPNYHPS